MLIFTNLHHQSKSLCLHQSHITLLLLLVFIIDDDSILLPHLLHLFIRGVLFHLFHPLPPPANLNSPLPPPPLPPPLPQLPPPHLLGPKLPPPHLLGPSLPQVPPVVVHAVVVACV